MARVAVIGAGVAGLGAAWSLRRVGIDVAVFEREGRLGGRVSTIERGPVHFDDGAQFVRAETAVAKRVLFDELPGTDIVDIPRDVRPFDRNGTIGPGDAAQNAEGKLVFREGLRALPEAMAGASGATIRLGWRVETLEMAGGAWALKGRNGAITGFDAVVVTCPAPVTAQLLRRSGVARSVSDALAQVQYRSIISVSFEPEMPVSAPEDAYALVNTDRKHDVSWLAFEEAKPGYVPPGRQVITAQMADRWSAGRLADPDRDVVSQAVRSVSGLLGRTIAARWACVTRWPHALPNSTVAAGAMADSEAEGLFFAGDAFVGGRVHLALENGLAAGERAGEWLSGRS